MSRSIGHVVITVMAAIGVGYIQEADNELHAAAETYRGVLRTAGDPPLPAACEAYLGLARIEYEWNDLDAAMRHSRQAVQLAQQLEHTDRAVAAAVFLARLKLALGEASDAAFLLSRADGIARRHNYASQITHIAAVNVLALLRQGNVDRAAFLAKKHELPLSLARVCLAQGDASAALAILERLQGEAEAAGLEDERLKISILQAIAHNGYGDRDKAVRLLREALIMAEPGGFIRTFIDEGLPVRKLLPEAAHGLGPDYPGKLLAAFEAEERLGRFITERAPDEPSEHLIEPLSRRELEVLQLIAQGCSNREICERLFLALSTVKGHNRVIFDKLQVRRRTEAVALARRLGLL
jgi:LuxR family maltose regulon positive regulatory protein